MIKASYNYNIMVSHTVFQRWLVIILNLQLLIIILIMWKFVYVFFKEKSCDNNDWNISYLHMDAE